MLQILPDPGVIHQALCNKISELKFVLKTNTSVTYLPGLWQECWVTGRSSAKYFDGNLILIVSYRILPNEKISHLFVRHSSRPHVCMFPNGVVYVSEDNTLTKILLNSQ